MDKLQSMEAFVRVVDAGSFTEAARRWGRSKASVSQSLSQLEEHLGVRLLRRTTRRMSLTEAGRAHLEVCRQVLSLVDESEQQLHAEHAAPRGVLRVTAPPGVLSVRREALITDFIARYPALQLELLVTHRMLDLVEERVDVAIRLTQPEDSALIAQRLAPAPLSLVAAPAWLAKRPPITHPSQLADLPCICDTNFRFHPRWPFRVNGERVEVEVSGPVRADNPLLVKGLVADGLGVGLVPRMLLERDLAEGRLVELLPGAVDAGWSVWAVTHQRRRRPERARVFIEHLKRALAQPASTLTLASPEVQ
ncbi:MAG: LysR family transcriptional regulator [Alphaproteobacteria bacterium]|nr:LysR family transcriptional regulator [Alphaproteobacteria bacterium]MCB9792147.1 LysR family transcriptional regulator [Alphaproteobacteria bacterium]